MLLALLACNGPADPDSGSVPTTDRPTDTTPTLDDTSLPTTPTVTTPTGPSVFPNDCDPTVAIPGILDDKTPTDPHFDSFGASPEPFQVRVGWPSSDPSTSAGFLWRSDLDTLASVVEYGVDDALDQRAEGVSYLFNGLPPGDQRMHEVRLCDGLLPDTTYSYRVGGVGHFSATYQFRTAPAPGSDASFRFAFAGDSRAGYVTWGILVAAMDAMDPDFLVFTGDAVGSGTNQAEWDLWFTAMGDFPARKPVVSVHGNHEFLSKSYFSQVVLPNNEQWFELNYGDLQLVVLNDTVLSPTDRTDQTAFLDARFAASPATHRVVAHHQSVYATCTVHGSNETQRADWVPSYEAGGVDLVLQGHNHIYERSVPILADVEAPVGDGIVYVVSGGAGASLYVNVLPEWFSDIAIPVRHFGLADVGPTGIDVQVRDVSGNVIDSFFIPAD